ncbi:hypothetical protein ACF0H5_012501 [Mactra antiquata]
MIWLVLVFIGLSSAWANDCPDDICWRTLCAPVTNDTCNGAIIHKGSHCECCDVCETDVGPCAKERSEVNVRLEADTNHMLLGLTAPTCDSAGYYTGMQIRGSQAFCVTKNGTMIDGYSVYRWMTGDNMNCQCARDQYDYMQTGLIGKMFHCEANGNYASVGCTGSVCYCQDLDGKQVGTTTVPIGEKDSLNC